MGKLDERTAIVTGGTRGIGRAIAERFAAEGANVIAAARHPPAEPFRDPGGPIYQEADMSKTGDIKALMAFTRGRFNALDILVNNAGVEIEKSLEQTSEAEFDWLMSINLKGVFTCCKEALELMRKGGGGSIINIGSIEGFAADPHLAAYNASKGAVHALTKSIAVDHGPDGIRCNAIAPGWIETEMTASYWQHLPDPEAAERAMIALHPVRRLGRPEDIANLALWLAGDESTFATGQVYVLDGGLTARVPFPHSTA